MSAPEPAVPSEGANFYWLHDVPDDWEWRYLDDDDIFEVCPPGLRLLGSEKTLVEARPAPQTVMVEILADDARAFANPTTGYFRDYSERIAAACRKALES